MTPEIAALMTPVTNAQLADVARAARAIRVSVGCDYCQNDAEIFTMLADSWVKSAAESHGPQAIYEYNEAARLYVKACEMTADVHEAHRLYKAAKAAQEGARRAA